MVFNAVFNIPPVLLLQPVLAWSYFVQVLSTIFFPSQWQLSMKPLLKQWTGERGMVHLAMTIINPQKEDWDLLFSSPGSVFTNHSQEHSLSFSQKFANWNETHF